MGGAREKELSPKLYQDTKIESDLVGYFISLFSWTSPELAWLLHPGTSDTLPG